MPRTSTPSKLLSRRAVLAVAAAGAFLAGCAPWPGEATGGLAERHPSDWVQGRQIEERYMTLANAGADMRMPARMGEARELLIRARREHAGGLIKDAAYTLGAVDTMLSSIEHDMPRVSALPRRTKAGG